MLVNQLNIRCSTVNIINFLKLFSITMPRDNVKYFYAVGKGRRIGVFDSWPECKKQIDGLSNAKYKKFPTYKEAEEFVNYWSNYASPQKESPQKEPQFQSQQHQSYLQPQSNRKELVSKQKDVYFDKRNDHRTSAPMCRIKFEYGEMCGIGVSSVKKENVYIKNDEDFILLPKEIHNEGETIPVATKRLYDCLYLNPPKIDFKNLKRKDNPFFSVLNLIELENQLKERKSLKSTANNNIGNQLIELTETIKSSDNASLTNIVKALQLILNQFKEPEKNTEDVAQAPSTSNSVAEAVNINGINNDSQIYALNLRLDSFEKRFDSLLKEVGALTQEVKEIKKHVEENKVESALESRLKARVKKRKRSQSSSRSGTPEESNVKPSTSSEADNLKIKKEKSDLLTFEVGPDDYVNVYTDGCCHNNGKSSAKAGIGVWFGENHPLNVSRALDGPATNNNGEIQAARTAIELAAEAGVTKLKIHTDSGFLLDCVNNYMKTWKVNGWKLASGGPVKNRVELEKLDKAMKLIANIKWEKVPAHSGVYGNEMADKLANEGARFYRS